MNLVTWKTHCYGVSQKPHDNLAASQFVPHRMVSNGELPEVKIGFVMRQTRFFLMSLIRDVLDKGTWSFRSRVT